MPTFQDARDGLGALLKDGKNNLSPDERDILLRDAARLFSRRFPTLGTVETSGDGGFEYPLPTGYVDGFSTFLKVFSPWDPTEQDPTPLEAKKYGVFQLPTGPVFRFREANPQSSDKFLQQFTVPHQALATDVADVVGVLTVANTAIDGDPVFSDRVDVEKAEDVQVYLHVTAKVGTGFDIFIQVSEDGTRWADAGAFNEITVIGDFVLPLKAQRVAKFIRLRYKTTGGSFTLEASVVQENPTGTFTIPDHSFDAYKYLAAAIAAQALADFYSNLLDNQLEGDTTDYEGKATFWHANHDKWNDKWKEEADKIAPRRGASAFAVADMDLKGTTGFEYLTHAERDR